MTRSRSWWPNTPGAAETRARVRDAMTRARVTAREIQAAANARGGPAVALSTVTKTLAGGCRQGDKGERVRQAAARLTRRPAVYLFGPADEPRNGRGRR